MTQERVKKTVVSAVHFGFAPFFKSYVTTATRFKG